MNSKPSRCWFSTFIVVTCIRLILYCSISFRAVPKALNVIFTQIPGLKNHSIPSDKSINRWLTRVGLYKLNTPKEIADDWAFIIDNSIQVGTQKCLLILGVRLNSVKWKSLTFENVEVISMDILESSDKNNIFQALEKAQEKVGKVAMVCADDGPDIRGGVDLFCNKYNIGRVFDTIHKIGTFLKADLEEDPQWKSLISKISQAKKKMQQTAAAHLMPPNLRSKSRFLNIDILIKWLIDAMFILTSPNHPDSPLLKKYCGWLLKYRTFIEFLRQLDIINKHVRQFIRDYGLSSNTGEHIENLLEDVLKSVSYDERACQYAGKLIDFFHTQSKIVPSNQVWLGTSEIIEALFGKLKFLEQDQHKGGFTSLVLAMAACTGSLESTVISDALEKIKTKDVNDWVKSTIGETHLSKRRKSLGGWRKKIRKNKKKERVIDFDIENVQESAGNHLVKIDGF